MILVTGGAGYIGSHICLELLERDHEVIVIDNLSNSHPESLLRVQELTGKTLTFVEGDLLDQDLLRKIFEDYDITAVIHLAGLKAVGESVSMPLTYYHNNITGTLMLCEVMKEFDVKQLIFSSSATVYGTPDSLPLTESASVGATNPYGRTKLMLEEILQDLYVSDEEWSLSILRYFNPIGSHPSGRIGEDPAGIPNNLMPYITKVAVGHFPELKVFGDDYPTVDGTGVRDYIHVVDLARGHVHALEKTAGESGIETYNLGTGEGYSVLQLVKAFEKASGRRVPYAIEDRRPGDIAECFADPAKAHLKLGWQAEKTIDDMCVDSWNWRKQNPEGYTGEKNASKRELAGQK
ncbi:UDP-glucose 4-epimerase GalE [Halobacillus litoralis]|uniref:UDP-glucose 4-epimerase GalE n=1 Tax=Halobacillus litoralis TaxID=45668 RepID=UPI001CD3C4B0|nr:UDP-glucose 4-epimerase GalE [Halobacillus litoralis]MCA1022180.1 UDP-glucose 4-epimerase GalE [Halobacillus litoralis]